MPFPPVHPACVLLLTAWGGCFLIARQCAARGWVVASVRIELLLATAFWTALLTVIVEAVSLGRALNQPGLMAGWAVGNAIVWAVWLGLRGGAGPVPQRSKPPWDAVVMLAVAGAFLAALGVFALVFVSANYDAMTYHLPRVLYWLQQGSVEHFATNDERQIFNTPWPGFLQANLWLLTGGLTLANLPQWFALAGTMLAASWLAGAMMPSGTLPATVWRAETLAALLVVTIPMVLTESISTANDVLVTFWFAVLAVATWLVWHEPRRAGHWLLAGLALGLGVAAKSTMIFYGFPFGLVLLWALWRQTDARRWRHAVLLGSCAVLPVLPHFARNTAVFGHPLGSKELRREQQNGIIGLWPFLSVAIRSLKLYSDTGWEPASRALGRCLHQAHLLTGLSDVDERTTFVSSRTIEWEATFAMSDCSGGSVHHLLVVAAALGLVAWRPRLNRRELAAVALPLAGLVLFCLLVRWQRWGTRIHLGWLAVLMPWCAAVLTSRLPRWAPLALSMGLAAWGVMVISRNISLPLRVEGYAVLPPTAKMLHPWRLDLHRPMRLTAETVGQVRPRTLGLKLHDDSPEFPLWSLLRKNGYTGLIEHWGVTGESACLQRPVLPEAFITDCGAAPSGPLTNHFSCSTNFPPYTLYWKPRTAR